MCAREERGTVIANNYKIVKQGKLWRVPSQSNNGVYSVSMEREFCTCPDHVETGNVCKHMHAVRLTVSRSVKESDGTTTTETISVERKTYRQDWSNYNRAQVNEHNHFQALLAELCGTLPKSEEKRGRGRPALAQADSAFCAIYKTYSTLSARRFMGNLEDSANSGYVSRVPHFNSVLNWFDTENATGVLMNFVRQSALPLAGIESEFAIDATGFAGARYLQWTDEKYGAPKREAHWIKLHALIGTKTNVIVRAMVTEKDQHDSPMLPWLVASASTDCTITELSADKAYCGRDNFEAVEAHGGTFYPAFKKNATGQVGGAYAKAYHLMMLNKEEYDRHYHRRSNVESTFSAVKRKFGSDLRSKTDLAMKNETLAKCVCHNITCLIGAMYELGVSPMIGCTNNRKAAQVIAH